MASNLIYANRAETDTAPHIVFDVPTGQRPSRQVLQTAADAAAAETDTVVEISAQGRQALVDTRTNEPVHDVVDVAESVLQNQLGDGSSRDSFSVRKSILRAVDAPNKSPQPCFEPSSGFSADGISRAEELFNLVAAPQGSVEQVGGRIYFDTPGQSITHVQLDVSEIIVRRLSATENVTVPRFHTIKIRDPHA